MSYADINGTDLYFELKGTGKTLVFIHSPVLPSEIFRLQLRELANSYQVLLFDIRGHGYSHPSPVDWNFSNIADDLKQLLDYLKIDRVWICGYSAGASIAFEFTLMFPERVNGLIQLGTVPEISDRMLKRIVLAGVKAAEKDYIHSIAFLGALINTKSFQLFKSLYKASKQTHSKDAYCYYRSYYYYSCRKNLPKIDQPVLLVYGEKDKLFGKYANQMMKLLQNRELVYLKKAHHVIPGNFPGELNEAICYFIK